MLKIISKVSYKFSTNAIYILFSIVADFVLKPDDYGRFIIILAIQVLIFNTSDIFNSKFLLGEFSSNIKGSFYQKILRFKLIWGFFTIIILSSIYLYYEVSFYLIFTLFLINYIQLISSTMATYIFSNENNLKLLYSNLLGGVACFSSLCIYYIMVGKFTLYILVYSIAVYRLGEVLYLYFNTMKLRYHIPIKKQDFKEASSFYFQLILSIGSSKLFMLFLPSLLPYHDISIIGEYEYIVAIPLFFISVLTMSTYSKLYKNKVDFDFIRYSSVLNKYYIQSLCVICFFLILQLVYIINVKTTLVEYLGFIFLHDISLVFTALQGYILFFWKMNRLVVKISIFVLLGKNLLMYMAISKFGLIAFFVVTLLFELSVLIFIKYKVSKKIKNYRLAEYK